MTPFPVRRLCDPGDCEPDCSCAEVLVDCDVDELSGEELRRFAAEGTEEQRAEIDAWLGENSETERAA